MGKKLFNLLFELSNEDRFDLLLQIQNRPQRLSHVAKKLKLTRQETSRNLTRLSNAQLIDRDMNGFFYVTAYGKQVLKLLPGFTFLSKYKEYFNKHDLSILPTKFFYRIGELVKCPYIDDALETFDDCERVINQANEYVWFITHQHSVSMLPHLQNALEHNIKIRIIIPSDLDPPPGYFEHEFVKAFLKVHKSAVQSGLYEERQLPKTDICLTVADHNQGRIVFPTLDGNFDYKGFTIVDKQSHDFCKDLFMFYWNKASHISQ